ncbi:DUF1294 domain-containing protein [Gracilibacillus marinus]|jgi:uncharacterized membrane protein YsdA (DUF1294 family)|uniref:DUF1294 domain-containing protein n=1 Tax=Gracilibacillus marinus TaxID=630535 RepID=A0ABV8VX90_9BACI
MWIYLLCMNVIGFFVMSVDKRKARKQQWRIPEQRIWLVAVIGGALGCTLGMYMFRHKTKHTIFVFGLPFLSIVHCSLLIYYYIILS